MAQHWFAGFSHRNYIVYYFSGNYKVELMGFSEICLAGGIEVDIPTPPPSPWKFPKTYCALLSAKHYHPAANRALPAVIFSITGQVGELNRQRIALPRTFERVNPKDPGEGRLWREMLKQVKKNLAEDEIAVLDAGVKLGLLQELGLERYVVHLAKNFTARRNYLPAYAGHERKAKYGALVRPLLRIHNSKTLAASGPRSLILRLRPK